MPERPFRLTVLVVILALAVAYSPPLQRAVRHGCREVLDLFDNRPARTVLIVGNSRVYFNDMPFMIRRIADATGDPVRWDVTELAKPAATFESHWNDPDVHALLARRWDLVILQAESAAQTAPDRNETFHRFGSRLALEARKAGSPVALVVGWVYGEELFDGYAGSRDRLDRDIQREHRRFAEDNRVELINVGRVWRSVERGDPALTLTTDGNHPSIAGSYLEALAIYRYLADSPVFAAAYRPKAIDAPCAQLMAREVEKGVSPRLWLRASLIR